jgi:N-acetylglucosaminyldiphosphoundecaprenol N-acetyl-beta-D-mannosaminyltransferase
MDKTSANWVHVLGVKISNLSQSEAIALIESWITTEITTRSIFLVNAHTLNLSSEDRQFQAVLQNAHRVFADGTGVRWAAKLRGIKLKENLVGTDLIPRLFGRERRYNSPCRREMPSGFSRLDTGRMSPWICNSFRDVGAD